MVCSMIMSWDFWNIQTKCTCSSKFLKKRSKLASGSCYSVNLFWRLISWRLFFTRERFQVRNPFDIFYNLLTLKVFISRFSFEKKSYLSYDFFTFELLIQFLAGVRSAFLVIFSFISKFLIMCWYIHLQFIVFYTEFENCKKYYQNFHPGPGRIWNPKLLKSFHD